MSGADSIGQRGWLVIGVVTAAFIVPTIPLPLGPDSSMFFVSAQKILHEGAVHYRDIVDVKPPLIYYLYAFALLFGESSYSIRILDVLIQLATCAGIALLVRRAQGSDAWAAAAAMTYGALYGSLGYTYTMQVESYLGPVLIGIAWMVLVRRSRIAFFAAGALAGVAMLLKFPIAIVLGCIVLCELTITRDSLRRSTLHIALACAGFALVVALLALYLVAGDALVGFAQMNQYIAGYVQTNGRGVASFAAELVRDVPEKIMIGLSATVVVAILAAVPFALRSRSPRHRDDRAIELLQFMLLAIALLTVSLIIEGKYYPYQIGRLHACGAIVSSYAIAKFLRHVGARMSGMYTRIVGIALLAIALVFSPVAGWLWFTVAPVAALATHGHRGFDAYFTRMAMYYPRSELLAVGNHIKTARKAGDRVLALSSIAALVHYHSGSIPDHRIYHSAFLLAVFGPPEWRDEMRRYFVDRRPAFVVVQRGDWLFDKTSTDAPSSALIDTLNMRATLERDYRITLETERLVVYSRTESGRH